MMMWKKTKLLIAAGLAITTITGSSFTSLASAPDPAGAEAAVKETVEAEDSLAPEKLEAIRADYIALVAADMEPEDVHVEYYGTYHGGDVVVIRAGIYLPAVQTIRIGSYTFDLPNVTDRFFFYKDHTFTRVEDAYAQGLMDAADLKALAIRFGAQGCLPFTDVNEGDWFYPYVYNLYQDQIVEGIIIGNSLCFGPSLALSRAQLVTILYRMEGEPAAKKGLEFSDVRDDAFYSTALNWASSSGVEIVTGYTEGQRKGEFGPADPITREQLALMMYRYAKYDGLMADTATSDAVRDRIENFGDYEQVSGYAQFAMGWAVDAGLITGDQGRLNPQGNASRAVCAAIIQRYLESKK